MIQSVSEHNLNALISSLDDIVFELDDNGFIVNAWAAEESRFFMPKEQFMYKHMTDVLPPPLNNYLHEAFLTVKNTGEVREVEYRSPYEEEFFLARLNLVKGHEENKAHISALIKNITEKKKGEQELLKAKEAAEQALLAKSYFLSSISHEIRTPMNAIIGLTDILLEQEHNAEHLEYLKSIKHSSANLLKLINDLLDFSKIEAGKILFEQIDFDLYKQLSEIEKTFQKRIAEKGIRFAINIDINTPQFLKGDPYRLNQVLVNLISNAIKFTQDGYVKLSVQVVAADNVQNTILFTIEDTGIGIAADKQDLIFESFTQASAATTRKFGGTGLGLAITKNIIQQQGGTIRLKSEENKGTTFYVELPFLQSQAKDLSIQQTGGTPQSLSHLRVLVAEDNLVNQLVIRKILEDWQAQYEITVNGKQALEQLKMKTFDIILMDLQMPEMDGMEATHSIRTGTSVKNPDIPIIAFTADAFAETRVKVLESGMNDFVTKPFDKNDLYTKILKHTTPAHH